MNSLKLKIAQASLAAIVALSVTGCRDSPSSTEIPLTPSASSAQRQVEYAIKKEFTNEEFEAFVNEMEAEIEAKSGLQARLGPLEEEIGKISGQSPSVSFASDLPSLSPGVHPDGTYELRSNSITLITYDPLSVFKASSEGYIDKFESFRKYHEFLHNLTDISSPRDSLDTFLIKKRLVFSEFELKGDKLPIIHKLHDSSTIAQIATIHGKVYWDARITRALAESILEEYAAAFTPGANDPTFGTAEQALYTRITQILNTDMASWMMTEAQANFATPRGEAINYSPGEIERLLEPLITRPSHQGHVKQSIEKIIEGYTTLSKQGITGVNADIEMAILVGQSTVPSDNEFEPYDALARNVAAMNSKFRTAKPSQADVAAFLARREKESRAWHDSILRLFSDFIDKELINPALDSSIPAGLKARVLSYTASSVNLEKTPEGYRLKTTVAVTFSG